MLVKSNGDALPGTVVGPDGVILARPTIMLSMEEAELLRRYKKFLERRGLREGLFCQNCWSGDIADGVEAYVTDSKIGIICRCQIRIFMGQSY